MEQLLTLSLRKYLEDVFDDVKSVAMIEDGVVLSKREKPFLSVEYLGEEDELVAAGRRSYEEAYHFQIGVYAVSRSALLSLGSRVKTELRKPEGITLYDATANPTETSFACDVSGFTPIRNEDTSSETQNHRGYFDAYVTIYRNTGETVFTQ